MYSTVYMLYLQYEMALCHSGLTSSYSTPLFCWRTARLRRHDLAVLHPTLFYF